MSGHPVAQWVWPPKLSIVGRTWKEVQEVGSRGENVGGRRPGPHKGLVDHISNFGFVVRGIGNCVVVLCSVAQSHLILYPHGLQPARILCTWDFSGENTGVGCCFLLLGIFLTQGLNLRHLRLCIGRWILYHRATWVVSARLECSHTHDSPMKYERKALLAYMTDEKTRLEPLSSSQRPSLIPQYKLGFFGPH